MISEGLNLIPMVMTWRHLEGDSSFADHRVWSFELVSVYIPRYLYIAQQLSYQ